MSHLPAKVTPIPKAAPGFEQTRQFICVINVPILMLVPEKTFQEGAGFVEDAISEKVEGHFQKLGFAGATLAKAQEVPAKGSAN